jgi:acyl dehydratase
MFGIAGPMLTVGVAITVTDLLAEAAEQGAIPVVENVKDAVPLYPGSGVHVAFAVFALGENEPPAGVLHVPPVAPPPNPPPSPAVVPP